MIQDDAAYSLLALEYCYRVIAVFVYTITSCLMYRKIKQVFLNSYGEKIGKNIRIFMICYHSANTVNIICGNLFFYYFLQTNSQFQEYFLCRALFFFFYHFFMDIVIIILLLIVMFMIKPSLSNTFTEIGKDIFMTERKSYEFDGILNLTM